MSYYNDLSELGIILKKTSGICKVKCPECSHTRKNKKDTPLSVNIDEGLYNCHNRGYSGNVKFKSKPDYIVPVKQNAEVTERVLKWFATRKISEPTLVH